jgi:hypothetical protein
VFRQNTAQEGRDLLDKGDPHFETNVSPNFFLQLRGPATALSRKFLHDLITVRHFNRFL